MTATRNSSGSLTEGTLSQQRLAYNEMTVSSDGRVVTDAEKRLEREKLGYCTSCRGMPILLYQVKKNRLNPFWVSKEARAVAGECAGGICFVCHPHKDPANKGRTRFTNTYVQIPKTPNQRRNVGANGNRQFPMSPPMAQKRFSEPCDVAAAANRESTPAAETIPNTLARTVSSPLPSPDPYPTRHSTGALTSTSLPESGNQAGSGSISRDSLASIPAPPMSAPGTVSIVQSLESNESSQQSMDEPSTPEAASPSSSAAKRSSKSRPRPPRPTTDEPLDRIELMPSSQRPSNDTSATKSATIPSRSRVERPERSSLSEPPTPIHEADVDMIISELDSLVSALLQTEGSGEILAQSLLGAMREHKSKETVLAFCLRTIWESCKGNADNGRQIMNLGGPEDIISTLKKFRDSHTIQEVGSGAVWALSIHAANRPKFIQLGACSVIMAAIEKYIDKEDVLRPAVGAVRTLSPEREARDLLKVAEGSKYVALAMMAHPTSVSIQRDGCAFLSNSAVDIENQFVHVVPESELEAVVQAMENHRNEVSVMAGACFAIKNYTFEETNCRRLSRIKNFDSLIQYAAGLEASPDCMQDAHDIIESMQLAKSFDASIEDESYMSIVSKVESQMKSPDTPKTVVEFINESDWSPKLTAYGLQLLRRVILEEPSHRNRLFEMKMMPQIVQRVKFFLDEEMVCEEACRLFAALATEEHRRTALTGAGVCDIIFHSLKSKSNERLLASSLETLELLASTNAGECQTLARANRDFIRSVVESNGSNEAIMMSGIGILSMVE